MLIIDDREVTQHPELTTELSIPVKVERRPAGDYIFMDNHQELEGIERCEIGNLMQKIRNGEIESQLTRCDQEFSKVILLIEGVYDHMGGFITHFKKNKEGTSYYRNRIEPQWKYVDLEAFIIRISELGFEVFQTPTFECSMRFLECLYNQRTKDEKTHTLFKKIRPIKIPVKLSSNPAVPKLLALCPRMQEKVAIRLINRFGSIMGILLASDKDLMEIDGLGKTGIDNLKKSVS